MNYDLPRLIIGGFFVLTTVLLIIILVGYCSGKYTVNYGTIGAYEAFVFGDDGWSVGGVW